MPLLTDKPPKSDKAVARGKRAATAGLPQGSSALPAAGEKPKLTFYNVLPGQEEPVTEKELRERSRLASRSQKEGSKDVYFIQAGLVLNPGEDCHQKPSLSFLPVSKCVQSDNSTAQATPNPERVCPHNKKE